MDFLSWNMPEDHRRKTITEFGMMEVVGMTLEFLIMTTALVLDKFLAVCLLDFFPRFVKVKPCGL